MAEWDTRAIQTRVVEAARLPRGSRYQTLANLLPLLDQHLRTLVVPELLRVAEGWLASTATYDVVAGTDAYRLPYRSLRVLDVALLDASGRPQVWFSRATPEQTKGQQAEGWIRNSGPPHFWAVEANSLRLYPTPDASDVYTLRVRYARRPGRLVDSQGTGVWTVVSYNSGTGVVQVAGSGTPTVSPYDFIRGTPNFESMQDDVVPALVTPAGAGLWDVMLADWSGAPPEADDYMAVAGTSPVPQVPLDYLSILEMSVEEQLLRNDGDPASAQEMGAARLALMASASAVLEPRATENAVVVPGWEP